MSFVVSDRAGSEPAPTFACAQDKAMSYPDDVRTVLADDFLEDVVSRFCGKSDALFDEVRRLRALRTRNEDARKRGLSPALVTTPNSGRIQSLRGLILNETQEMRPLLRQVMDHIAIIEIARQQLHVFEAAEGQIQGERADRDQRQLTPLTYEFVDVLYTHYDVDGSALSALEGEDYLAIAEIVKRRHAAVVPELYDSNMTVP